MRGTIPTEATPPVTPVEYASDDINFLGSDERHFNVLY